MIVICNHIPDVWFNLAAEEYLLKNFREDIFMLWRSEPSVVMGKYQDAAAEINLEFARREGIKVARRFSGGGTVYHDKGNFNLSFIRNGGLAASDSCTGEIVAFLRKTGVAAYSDERRGIYVDGLKISGSAQALHRQRSLHHATLLFSSDLDVVETVLSPPSGQTAGEPPEKGKGKGYYVKSVKSPVTNLSGHLPGSVSMKNFRDLLLGYFAGPDTKALRYELSEKDIRGIMNLRDEKYASLEWIFR